MDYTQYKHLEFRRRFLVMVGAEITIADPESNHTVGFIKMKAWKLRKDVRLFTNESQVTEVLRISARNIIDFGATYDVIDSPTNTTLYSLRRKGLRSVFVRDHWDISDAQGNVYGYVQETSNGLALARRWLGLIPYVGILTDLIFAFAPQTYQIVQTTSGGPTILGTIVHLKNPVIVKMSLDTSMAQVSVDPKLTMAVTSLLSIIEAQKG